MTDNNGIDVGKYQNALSDLCGVEYPYMRGDPAVEAIAELIGIAVEQAATIKSQQAEIVTAKRIAIEEFAAAVKNIICANTRPEFSVTGKPVNIWNAVNGYDEIDALVKEMVGDNDD